MVVSVMIILLSLLLPALKTVKDRGKQILCSSNLKQLGSAHMLYSADYKDRLPETPSNTPQWGYQLAAYDNYEWDNRQNINRYSNRRCPSSQNPPMVWMVSQYRINSYGYNRWIGQPTLYGTYIPHNILSTIQLPTKLALMTCCWYTDSTYGKMTFWDAGLWVETSINSPQIAYWHGHSSTVLFIDGHILSCARGQSTSYTQNGTMGYMPKGTVWSNGGTLY